MIHTRGVCLTLLGMLSLAGCSNSEQPEAVVSSNTFALAPCGDGVLDEGEQCDDGNEVPGDGCDAHCQINPFPINASGAYPRAEIAVQEVDTFLLSLAANSEVEIFTSDGIGGCPGDTVVRVFFEDEEIAFDDDGGIGACSHLNLALNAGDYRIQITGFGRRVVSAYTLSVVIDEVICGDGVVNGLEECDDGGIVPGDGCDEACLREPLCGDGFLDEGEVCDDGNVVAGDGCDAACAIEGITPGVGDLVITEIMSRPIQVANGQWFEVHNPTETDYQLYGIRFTHGQSSFVVEGTATLLAGDYFVFGQSDDLMNNGGVDVDYLDGGIRLGGSSGALIIESLSGETIDEVLYSPRRGWPSSAGAAFAFGGVPDAALNDIPARWCVATEALLSGNFGTPGAANPPCPVCGDGIVNGDEACDDGNLIAEDGCENDCQLTPACGDGTIDEGEECDDGNAVLGDGCTPECTVEIRVIDGAGEYLSNGFGQGSIDVYTLEVDALTSVLLETSGDFGCPGDTLLTVFDDAGARIARNDDGGQGLCSLVEAALTPGTYRIEVSGFLQREIPAYTLTVSLAPIVCGDGLEVTPETCDDGNVLNGDGCDAQCELECGNGNLDPSEECDDGNRRLNDGCGPTCLVERCGDGIQQRAEGCDDGNVEVNDGCSAECELECGDGILNEVEACDDGNRLANDGCGPTCEIEVCGDGIKQALEECDDGNDIAGDGCVACEIEAIAIDGSGEYPQVGFPRGGANYVVFSLATAAYVVLTTSDGMEGCPGDTLITLFRDGDAITSDDDSGQGVCSQIELGLPAGDYLLVINGFGNRAVGPYVLTVVITPQVCGDGILAPGELCEDGNLEPGDGCSPECIPDCGDGRITGNETCDDGNLEPGDGCSAVCQTEICGNDIEDVNEECDDGNLLDGDGCTADCLIEIPCGDGKVRGYEECDGADLGQGCDALCTFETYPMLTAHYEGRSGLEAGGRDTYTFTVDDNAVLTVATTEIGGCPTQSGLQITEIGMEEPVFTGEGDGCAALAGLGLSAGEYRLTLDNVGASTHYGMTIDLVTPIDQGGVFNGAIAADGNDAFTFELAEAGRVELSWVPDQLGRCPRLSIMVSYNGELLGQGTTVNCAVITRELGVGQHQLLVSGGPETYQLQALFVGVCGDGSLNVQEQCDDGNLIAGDGCDAVCQQEVQCGDGQLGEDEQCDDGNLIDGDGCDAMCATEGECGDGVLDPGEACDDGDALACDSVCTPTSTVFDSGVIEWIASKGVEDEEFTFVVHTESELIIDTRTAEGACLDHQYTILRDGVVIHENDLTCGTEGTLEPGTYTWRISGAVLINFLVNFELKTLANEGGDFTGATGPGGDDLYLIDRVEPARVMFSLTEGCETVETLVWSRSDSFGGWIPEDLESLGECQWAGDFAAGPNRVQVVGGPNGSVYTLSVSFDLGRNLVITEFMKDPDAVIDGFGEWFELTNVGTAPVDLFGYSFRDLNGNRFTVDESVMVGVGEQVVLGRWNIPMINGGVELDYAYGHGMSLDNNADQILVYAPDGVLVDALQYGGIAWPRTRAVGHALQLDSGVDAATVDNTDAALWCVAQSAYGNGDFGTPGAPNDLCP